MNALYSLLVTLVLLYITGTFLATGSQIETTKCFSVGICKDVFKLRYLLGVPLKNKVVMILEKKSDSSLVVLDSVAALDNTTTFSGEPQENMVVDIVDKDDGIPMAAFEAHSSIDVRGSIEGTYDQKYRYPLGKNWKRFRSPLHTEGFLKLWDKRRVFTEIRVSLHKRNSANPNYQITFRLPEHQLYNIYHGWFSFDSIVDSYPWKIPHYPGHKGGAIMFPTGFKYNERTFMMWQFGDGNCRHDKIFMVVASSSPGFCPSWERIGKPHPNIIAYYDSSTLTGYSKVVKMENRHLFDYLSVNLPFTGELIGRDTVRVHFLRPRKYNSQEASG